MYVKIQTLGKMTILFLFHSSEKFKYQTRLLNKFLIQLFDRYKCIIIFKIACSISLKLN